MRDIKFRQFIGVSDFHYWGNGPHEDGAKWKGPCSNGGGGGQYPSEQYTGLKDKNGKEIYEGDIIAGIFVWGAVGGEVYFDKSVAAFGIKNDMLFDAHDLKNFEIKGNIHESPELLTTDI